MRIGFFVPCGAVVLAATASLAQSGPARRRVQGQKAEPPACQRMMSELEASDARFEAHVKQMNDAQGTEKIDAMAAALNELAAQHRTMREHMASKACPGTRGGAPGCPMPGCPMMGR
ncbi:MAG TPA: hypothetical protein VKW76_05270 [Candidatus Binatia bacterium]|nr:hypothetical protein [Candidatus Binatia bacterium]